MFIIDIYSLWYLFFSHSLHESDDGISILCVLSCLQHTHSPYCLNWLPAFFYFFFELLLSPVYFYSSISLTLKAWVRTIGHHMSDQWSLIDIHARKVQIRLLAFCWQIFYCCIIPGAKPQATGNCKLWLQFVTPDLNWQLQLIISKNGTVLYTDLYK